MLEHVGVLRGYAQELLDFCDACEQKAWREKVTWDDAGGLAKLRELLEPTFREE